MEERVLFFARPYLVKSVSTQLVTECDSFTCIFASTIKSSGANAPTTTVVQTFLGFVESSFLFTHNGGATDVRHEA